MPEHPGWYQMHGMVNGTVASGDHVEVTSVSRYVSICECDSEQETCDELDSPPSEGGGHGDGATATPTPTATLADGPGFVEHGRLGSLKRV